MITNGNSPRLETNEKLRWHFGWEFETTKQYFKDHPPISGDQVLVVSTQSSVLIYELAMVEKTTKQRIYLGKQFGWAGPAFYYSGKNCSSPTGQTRMVPIKLEVMEYFDKTGTSKIEMVSYLSNEKINDFLTSVNA